jgi:hypothetical protein
LKGVTLRLLALATAIVAAGVCLLVAATIPGVPTATVAFSIEPPDDGCAGVVIEEWVDDGHVDVSHPLPCYHAAIRALPADMRAYSSAPDDVKRALLNALHADRDRRRSGRRRLLRVASP